MKEFRETMDWCGLRDLGNKGDFLTGQRGINRDRLDYFLADHD